MNNNARSTQRSPGWAARSAIAGLSALWLVTCITAPAAAANPLVWSQTAKLSLTDPGPDDGFGSAVAMSGETAVIGAPFRDIGGNTRQGAAYVFVNSGAAWVQQGGPLFASDGEAGDMLGTVVSMSGDTIVCASDKQRGGLAYVFVRSGAAWVQQGGPLSGGDGASVDSVSVSGDTAVLGASIAGPLEDQGAAYVFVRSGSVWAQQGPTLTASDAAEGDNFGASLSVSGDTLVVGAPGRRAAFVFVRSAGTWTQQGPALTQPLDSGFFGAAVSVSGDSVLIGEPTGVAHVFERSGAAWLEQEPALSHLTVPDFGETSVSLSGDVALVGTPTADVGADPNEGDAYAYTRTGTTWVQSAQVLVAADGSNGSSFAASLAISGDTALIGAPEQDHAQGAVYVFVNGPCTDPSKCCVHDSDCPTGSFCASSGVCQIQAGQGVACTEAANGECLEAGCHVCASGQ
jgi:hypothetical protein